MQRQVPIVQVSRVLSRRLPSTNLAPKKTSRLFPKVIYFHFIINFNLYVSIPGEVTEDLCPNTWFSGILLFFFLMSTAFMGYVLPFGQMSFWGATVITNLLSPFPSLIEWVCGGHYVYNPSLKRFFLFHFQFPFLLCGFRILHLFYLHFLSSISIYLLFIFTFWILYLLLFLFPFHFSKRFLWFHSNSLSISSSNSFRDLFFLTSR